MSHPWDDFNKPKEVLTPPLVVKNPLSVRNYYTLSESELDKAIVKIRAWFIDFPNHKEYQRVCFALDVALCAKELKHDPFIDLVIDTLC